MMLRRLLVLGVLIGGLAAAHPSAQTGPGQTALPNPLFAPDNWWNQDVSTAPVELSVATPTTTFVLNTPSGIGIWLNWLIPTALATTWIGAGALFVPR